MHPLLLAIFEKIEHEQIQYCLLRDADQLDQLVKKGGEVDLLVRKEQMKLLEHLLAHFGFARIPAWGHTPHHFFLAYHEETDCWLKLDVVTEIAYGRPVQALQTTLATACLSNRRRLGPTYVPSPEDELVTTLLHCVLDKGYFKPMRQQRLQTLCHEITDEHYLSALLVLYWSPLTTWPQLATLIKSEQWAALLAERQSVAARLAGRDRVGTFTRRVRGRVLRKLKRWWNWLRPDARSVALLAPDGAGKSTLSEGIQETFYYPVRSIYMGLYQKNGDAAAELRLPGSGFLHRVLIQWRRYLSARYHQAQGQLVIFDRYSYDALLPSRRELSRAKQWRRWLLAHTCPAPNLILVLDAPGEILYSRKREHGPAVLEEQRQGYLQLKERLPQMVVIDATSDPEHVRRKVTAVIWRHYAN